MKRYFEYIGPEAENESGMASKFWEITVDGTSVTVHYGKIGAEHGQSSVKEFADAAEAQAHATKIIAEKTKKGYVEK